jgi:hypothetical protein
MSKQKTLTVYLSGGLGNQLFQYAAAKSLACRNSSQLCLDTWSGFWNDKTYQRNFSLGCLPHSANIASPLQRVPFWIEKVLQKSSNRSLSIHQKYIFGDMVIETNLRKYLPEIDRIRLNNNAWLWGYWQSEKYFANIKDLIGQEYKIPEPSDSQFLEMARIINSCDSIAVGVRLYEELPKHIYSIYNAGWITDISFYKDAANRLISKLKKPIFFVFSTANIEDLKQINFPGEVYYITPANGFIEAHKCLWLLSQCQHHIVSNSTFYWWGAWLAEYKNPKTRVIVSHCFANEDTVPSRWLTLRKTDEIKNLPSY